MSLRPVAPRPEARAPETEVLLREFREFLLQEDRLGLHELARYEERGIETGDLSAAVLAGPDGAPVGLAVWDLVPGVGRRVILYECRTAAPAADAGAFVAALEERSEHDGPIASVTPVGGGGVAPPDEYPVPPGYFRVDRMVLRLPSERELPDEFGSGRPDLRPLTQDDAPALVDLVRGAYDRFAGEANPWLYYRDPRRDARDAVREIVEGRRGAWLAWASYGVDVSGRLSAAILVNRSEAPRVSELVVAPSLRGIGIGRQLVLESARTLRERRAGELEVVLTSHDLRALRLYRRVGFEPLDDRGQAVWVRASAVGAAPPG